MSEENVIEDLATQKNNLYRDNYRRTLSALLLLIIVALSQIAILTYIVMTEGKPNYYATTTTGRVINIQSLSMPVVTDKYLLQWAALTARSAYNLDFVHYESQLKEVKPYFTTEGWEKFQAALDNAGVISSLKDNKLFMSAVVEGGAVILNQWETGGRHVWRVQMPLLVTYSSANEKRLAHFLVTMDIMRVPVLDAEKGIQVNDFSVTKRLYGSGSDGASR